MPNKEIAHETKIFRRTQLACKICSLEETEKGIRERDQVGRARHPADLGEQRMYGSPAKTLALSLELIKILIKVLVR